MLCSLNFVIEPALSTTNFNFNTIAGRTHSGQIHHRIYLSLFCNGTGHIRRTECPDCDGNGTFEYGHHEYRCKECDGEGALCDGDPDGNDPCPRCDGRGEKSNNPVRIGSVSVDARYLRVLEKLPAPMLYPPGPNDPVVCHFDGGIAVVMPIRSPVWRPAEMEKSQAEKGETG